MTVPLLRGKGKSMIGYAICGSFCTLSKTLEVLGRLVNSGYEVQPIMSERVYETDTRFWCAEDFRRCVRATCGREIIHTVTEAEPLGPKIKLTSLVVAPCTGNTLAKFASGISDGAVTMAMKAHMRNDRPLLIALASNDAMSANLGNIGKALRRKSVYFVPMKQDDIAAKPHSLVADFDKIEDCLEKMRKGEQARPLFLQ